MAFVRGIGGTPLNIFTHDVWYEHTLHPHPPIRKDPRAEGHDLKMPFCLQIKIFDRELLHVLGPGSFKFTIAFVRGIGGTPLNIFTHDVWYVFKGGGEPSQCVTLTSCRGC